jgi:excisionase family DNA binding protein
MTAFSVQDGTVSGDLSIEEAAVELGMSPTAVIRLLETGQLPSHLGPDGRRRRIARSDLEAHRVARFALRQQLVQEQRARRWAEASGAVPEPAPESSVEAR